MGFLVRRLLCLLLCLMVWAGLVLPAQAAYRCSAMEGSRIAEPCCPNEFLPSPVEPALSHHCCELLQKPSLDIPGTRPSPTEDQLAQTPPVLFVCAVLSPPIPARTQPISRRHFPNGVPPNTPLPRIGPTVLQI